MLYIGTLLGNVYPMKSIENEGISTIPRLKLDEFVGHIGGKSQLDNLKFPFGENGYYTEKMEHFEAHYHKLPVSYLQDFYKIYLLKAGSLSKTCQAEQIDCDKQALQVGRPGEVFRWHSVENVDGYFITFSKGFLYSLRHQKNMLIAYPFLQPGSQVEFILSETDYAQILNVFTRMFQAFTEKAQTSYRLVQLYVEELLVLLQHCARPKPPSTDPQNPAAYLSERFFDILEHDFIEGIKNDYVKTIGVNEMAQKLNTTASHLNYRLKEYTGKSAKSLIIDRYTLAAKCLLLHTDLPISQVCYLLGFENPPYFSHYFKKQTGKSPQGFRNEARGD